MSITKSEAVSLFGNKPSSLAKALKITTSAVSQWHDDEPIPDKQYLKIRYILKPDCFTESGNIISSQAS